LQFEQIKQFAIMKKIIIITLSTAIFAACGNSTPPVANTNVSATPATSTNSLVVTGHKTESQSTTPANSSSTSGGSPMQKPADIAVQTAAIEKADTELKAKPNDEAAKKALAKAYFDRAFVLTDAAQYRAALGDFRKGLKLDPSDEKAKSMHDQIIEIFQSIGREPPKEGEEPAPLGADKPKQ
jgi:tetratricopeptide (TPR) repeat protein